MIPSSSRNPNLDLGTPGPLRAESFGPGQLQPGSPDWWTGLSPDADPCPGKNSAGFIEALSQVRLDTCNRQEVFDYFANGWLLTELLFAGLQDPQAFYVPPYHGLRHPLIFYYVHPAALYINKLHVAGLLPKTVHPYYERLFETGVDEMSWDDLSKNQMDWPPLEDCQSYRRQCFELIRNVIFEHPELAPGHAPITENSVLWALFMGFEHERIHLETSSVLIRELPLSYLKRPPYFAPLHPSARLWAAAKEETFEPPLARQFTWVECPEGLAEIGKPRDFVSFGWDNEYGRVRHDVGSFACTKHLISNGDFYEFVKSGGYRDEQWWTSEGWRWRQYRNVKWPSFWVPSGPQGAHEYALRTLFELVSMPWNWPVVVNFHEAQAYTRWLSSQQESAHPLRLLTEAEHHRLRKVYGGLQGQTALEVWQSLWAEQGAAHSLRWGSEVPVDRSDRQTVSDLFGNVWQWLEDHFAPLPGFEVHPYYDDFSTPCFDGKHQMIMGGSFISAGDEASLYARFHFRPHFFQHAGFRIVDPLRTHNDGCVIHLTEGEVAQEEHASERLQYRAWSGFASRSEVLLPGLELREMACDALIELIQKHSGKMVSRALDIGCGVGTMSYRLAECADDVLGIDLSLDALACAKHWQSEGRVTCPFQEGKSLTLDPKQLSQLSWRQCDAGSLPADFVDFDLILASRILAQLPSPKGLLARMGGARALVKAGGLLVLVDSYQFDERKTPKSLWLKPELLPALLAPDFQLLEQKYCLNAERIAPNRVEVQEAHVSIWKRLV